MIETRVGARSNIIAATDRRQTLTHVGAAMPTKHLLFSRPVLVRLCLIAGSPTHSHHVRGSIEKILGFGEKQGVPGSTPILLCLSSRGMMIWSFNEARPAGIHVRSEATRCADWPCLNDVSSRRAPTRSRERLGSKHLHVDGRSESAAGARRGGRQHGESWATSVLASTQQSDGAWKYGWTVVGSAGGRG